MICRFSQRATEIEHFTLGQKQSALLIKTIFNLQTVTVQRQGCKDKIPVDRKWRKGRQSHPSLMVVLCARKKDIRESLGKIDKAMNDSKEVENEIWIE